MEEERQHGDQLVMNDMAHLPFIVDWYQLGGVNRGVSLTELDTWPDAFIEDLFLFLSEVGRATAKDGK